MQKDDKLDPSALQKALADYAQYLNTITQHAADIAHARRTMFNAYLAEGFTESQALELCKALSI